MHKVRTINAKMFFSRRGISEQVMYNNSTLLLCLAYLTRKRLPWFVAAALLQSVTVGFLVATCAHPAVNYTTILGKSKDGFFHWWSYPLFYPYLSVAQGLFYARRKRSKEPPYNEVSEGIFVGGWPLKIEDVPQGKPAIIDCTCELPKSNCVKDLPYYSIPVWDSRSPQPEDLTRAVKWALSMIEQNKPVLIHCAHGHGRSVMVACALLMYLGKVDSVEAAYNLIKTRRPKVSMNSSQMDALEKWLKQRQ